jgi:chemotaxis protein CheX
MKMNAEHMGFLVKSAQETFSTMLGLNAQMDKMLTRESEAPESPVISGIIGLSGDVQGVVIIKFPMETALTVVSRLIGEEVTKIDDDVTDTIGEITNIIVGSAKKYLNGLNVSIGLPTVVEGSDYVLHLSRDTPSVCASLSSDAGDFFIKVSTKLKGE